MKGKYFAPRSISLFERFMDDDEDDVVQAVNLSSLIKMKAFIDRQIDSLRFSV